MNTVLEIKYYSQSHLIWLVFFVPHHIFMPNFKCSNFAAFHEYIFDFLFKKNPVNTLDYKNAILGQNHFKNFSKCKWSHFRSQEYSQDWFSNRIVFIVWIHCHLHLVFVGRISQKTVFYNKF